MLSDKRRNEIIEELVWWAQRKSGNTLTELQLDVYEAWLLGLNATQLQNKIMFI